MQGQRCVVYRGFVQFVIVLIKLLPAQVDVDAEMLRFGILVDYRFGFLSLCQQKLVPNNYVPNVAVGLETPFLALPSDPIPF